MKKIISLFILSIALITTIFANNALSDKKIETIEFTVEGVCNMCKERIENAAIIKGVKFAEWDKDTKQLKVIFKADKTNETAIHKVVAEAGHDTNKVKADDLVYLKLPACCKYRDGVTTH